MSIYAVCTNQYQYTRNKLSNNMYDIENPDKIDGESVQIHLINEILAHVDFSDKCMRVGCRDTICYVCFENALTAGEKTTLDGIVSSHRYTVI